jgi:hypothetical protein
VSLNLPNFPYLWTAPVAADAAAGIDPEQLEQGQQFADDNISTLGRGLTQQERSYAWGIVSEMAKLMIDGSAMNLFDTQLKLQLLDFGMACLQVGRLQVKP